MNREVKEPFENALLFMLNTRGCQFYPQIFDEEFQRGVMRFLFLVEYFVSIYFN